MSSSLVSFFNANTRLLEPACHFLKEHLEVSFEHISNRYVSVWNITELTNYY